MAETLGVASLELVADGRGLDKSLDGYKKSVGNTMKSAGKAAGVGLAVGLGGVAAIATKTIADLARVEKINAQTNAAIKSTGGAANVSAKHVSDYADKIEKMSGLEMESVQEGQNLLLTFTNLKNGVGASNQIFDRTTDIMADLSTAMGQDMKSSALQLGKALNDPIKGVGALQRVGVTFTEEQKKQIKMLQVGLEVGEGIASLMDTAGHTNKELEKIYAEQGGSLKGVAKVLGQEYTPAMEKAFNKMTEGGKIGEAQKVILAELQKEFGGSAKAAGQTFAGQLAIAKAHLGDMAESVVGTAMPALSRLATITATEVVPKLSAWGNLITEKLRPVIGGLVRFVEEKWPAIKSAISGVVEWFRETAVPIWQSLGRIAREAVGKITEVVQANMPQIKEIFSNLGTVIGDIGKVAMPILKFALVEVLPKAIAIAIPIIKGITTVLAKVTGAFDDVAAGIKWMRDTGGDVLGKARDLFEGPLGKIAGFFEAVWTPLSKVKQAAQWLLDKGGKLIDLIGKIPFFGGGDTGQRIPTSGAGAVGSLLGATPLLGHAAAIGAAHGLSITSGLRPWDTGSKHSAGKAIDISNTYRGDPDGTPQMDAAFRDLVSYAFGAGRGLIDELFYDPARYSVDRGQIGNFIVGGHGDHIHVGIFDGGGLLMPGLTLAENRTGRPEAVVPLDRAGQFGSGRPLVVIEHLHVNDETEVELMVSKIIRRLGMP